MTEGADRMADNEALGAGLESPSVAIVILNYNGWRYTVECLESLGHLDYPRWWVVLVDNGSNDDSVEQLRAWARGEVRVEGPYVKEPGWRKPVPIAEYDGEPPESGGGEESEAPIVLIRLADNRGFAGGNNVAIRYALRRGADWTWLLNNDTVVAPESLREMLKAGQSDPQIAVVGCKLLYYDRPDIIQAAGGGRFYFWLGISRHYGWNRKDDGRWDRAFEPHYVTGASMLVRDRSWWDVGYFDDSFFFYGEEVEWHLRARRRGWSMRYVPSAIVYHREGGSLLEATQRDYLATYSRLRLCRRYRSAALLGASAVNTCVALRRLLWGDWQRTKAVLRAIAAAWRT